MSFPSKRAWLLATLSAALVVAYLLYSPLPLSGLRRKGFGRHG